MKSMKVVLLLMAVIIGIALVIIGIATNYMYDLAINARTSKEIISSKNAVKTSAEPVDRYDYRAWMIQESGFRHLYMTSEDGLRLHSYEIGSKNSTHNYTVLVHGYTASALSMAQMAKYFYDRQYNIIIPDLRGHGLSEGDYIAMGWDDRKDLLKLVDYIVSKDEKARIVLAGVSMGASAVLMTSGEALPENVVAVISDCGYTSVWEEFSYQLGYLFSLPEFPIMYTTDFLTRMRAGYGFHEASAIKQVKKSVTPTLFIHGTRDTFVPAFMVDELYDACSAPKEKLIVEGAGHAQCLEWEPELYKRTISCFLEKYGM